VRSESSQQWDFCPFSLPFFPCIVKKCAARARCLVMLCSSLFPPPSPHPSTTPNSTNCIGLAPQPNLRFVARHLLRCFGARRAFHQTLALCIVRDISGLINSGFALRFTASLQLGTVWCLLSSLRFSGFSGCDCGRAAVFQGSVCVGFFPFSQLCAIFSSVRSRVLLGSTSPSSPQPT